MKVSPVQASGLPAVLRKAQAFAVAVDKDRKAPGLKALGLADEASLKAVLGNKEIPLPFKALRSLHTSKGWVLLVGSGDAKGLTQEKIGTLANLACRAAASLGCRVLVTTLVADTWKDATAAQAV